MKKTKDIVNLAFLSAVAMSLMACDRRPQQQTQLEEKKEEEQRGGSSTGSMLWLYNSSGGHGPYRHDATNGFYTRGSNPARPQHMLAPKTFAPKISTPSRSSSSSVTRGGFGSTGRSGGFSAGS